MNHFARYFSTLCSLACIGATGLLGCSSTSTASAADGGPGGDAPGVPVETDGGSADGAAGASDLVLRGEKLAQYWSSSGESSEEMMAALEEETTHTRIAWTAKRVAAPADTFEMSWPKILAPGGSYRLGVAAYGRYALYHVGPVSGDVTLKVDQATTIATSDKTYKEAFDVLNTRLSLPPGTYKAALPADGTSVTFIIGPSGVLAGRSLSYGCTGAGACGRVSVTSNPTCEPDFVRGDTLACSIDVGRNNESLQATISVEGSGLRVKGKMASGTCCSTSFDVIATKTSADVDTCK